MRVDFLVGVGVTGTALRFLVVGGDVGGGVGGDVGGGFVVGGDFVGGGFVVGGDFVGELGFGGGLGSSFLTQAGLFGRSLA